MTDLEGTSSQPTSTIITREPQYVHPALVSGILLPPSWAAKAPVEPVLVKNGGEEDSGNVSHGQPPLFRHVSLNKIREQAGLRLQVQKNKHVKDLSVKKEKLQKLLQKLDSKSNDDHGSEWHDAEDLGELSMVTLAPEDTERDRTHERSLKDNVLSTKSEDSLRQMLKRSHLKVKIFSQRFFQMLSVPLSLASVVVIELVTFMTGMIKGFIIGVAEVIGEDVLSPLFGALLNSICEPVIRFLQSISVGIRNVFQPLLILVMEVLQHIALIIQAFRLVEIRMSDLPQQSINL